MNEPFYHVFTKTGDARAEADGLVARLGAATPADAGFHKSIYVMRADQTVVFLTGRDTALAAALRGRTGWQEPEQ
jgi:hypothetical protein